MNAPTLKIKKTPGIYRIYSKSQNLYYYGSAANLSHRWCSHKRELKNNKHSNPRLQNIYNKYGLKDLSFTVLEYVEKPNLIIKEQEYLDKFQPFGKNGLNICTTAGSMLGFKFSDESRKKMSLVRKGKPGRKHYTETKIKIGLAHKGKIVSEETRAKLRTIAKNRTKFGFQGKTHTSEAREKISKARNKHISVKCGNCDKMLSVPPWRIKKTKYGNVFCSRICSQLMTAKIKNNKKKKK